MLEQLQAEVPASVLMLARVPVSAKKAAALFKELGIKTLDELRAACQSRQLAKLKGFAAKTEEAILAGIDLAATSNARVYWADADRHAQSLFAQFRDVPGLEQIEAAGIIAADAKRSAIWTFWPYPKMSRP